MCVTGCGVVLLSVTVIRNEQMIMGNLSSCFWHKAVFMTGTFHVMTVQTVSFSMSDSPLQAS